MPIYEYECINCGNKLEVLQKFNEKPLVTCPQCGGRLHKLISQSSFILKGNGWYATDYARNDRKKEAAHGMPHSVKNTKKTPAKTEAKPKAEATPKH